MMSNSVWSIDAPNRSNASQSLECFRTGHAETQRYPLLESNLETFQQLHFNDSLQKAIHNMQLKFLSEVQKKSFPLFLDKSKYSGIVCAPRGSGKTLAILFLALEEASKIKLKTHPQILILCRTLELAKKLQEKAAELSKHIDNATFRLITRGKKIKKYCAISEDIIIGTPEKVYDIAGYDSLDLQKIETLIIDDADGMVPNKGHNNDVSRIRCNLSKSCRIILFSCTKTEEVFHFMDAHHKWFTEIFVPSKKRHMRQIYLLCSNLNQQMKAMVHFTSNYKYPGQSVVICNTKEIASRIVKSCSSANFPVELLIGSMKSRERNDVIELFNNEEIQTLVTTPAFMKVLKNDSVSLVFNFDQLLKDNKLNQDVYEERACMIGLERQGIVVNVIEKEWAPSVLPPGNQDLAGNEISSCDEFLKRQ